MVNNKLHFIKPGMFTLLQDAGRIGFQQFGVPTGGALDKTAMKLANWLVGNKLNHPILEITMIGPEIYLSGYCQIAFTGADISPTINGTPAPLGETLDLKNGDIISFGKLRSGCRAYLAVGGEWRLEKWLDSCSAAVFAGKDIVASSLISKGQSIETKPKQFIRKRICPANMTQPNIDEKIIRLLPGPEFEEFPRTYIAQFFSSIFRISNNSNRMGYRLDGGPVLSTNFHELISSGTVPGTIQVTHGAQPIILLADAQTTGGYYRIANVISADMDRLAQMKPGDEIKFELTDMETAYSILDLARKKMSFLPPH